MRKQTFQAERGAGAKAQRQLARERLCGALPAALAAASQVEWTGPADQFNVWGEKRDEIS